MQHAVEGNVPFAHINIIPVVKDALEPSTGTVMDTDHILFHAILKAGLTGKICHHELYTRKDIVEPKICTTIVHRVGDVVDKRGRSRCCRPFISTIRLIILMKIINIIFIKIIDKI